MKPKEVLEKCRYGCGNKVYQDHQCRAHYEVREQRELFIAQKYAPSPYGDVHGLPKVYSRGCRCEPCTESYRDAKHQWYEAGKAKAIRAKAAVAQHGSITKYAQGCRCEPCKAANSTYRKELRNRAAS